MADWVGFRFCPTDYEMANHYLRLKNLDGISNHFNELINTVSIYSFDPWYLPSQSRIKSEDQVWYFFSRKENKYKKGERQGRKTNSGFWKKTGVTMNIMSKRGTSRKKIGEKRVLVFHSSNILGKSKPNWVMHEYHSTCSSPNQMMTYTMCKVQFKGEATEISLSGNEIELSHHSLIPHINSSRGLTSRNEGSPRKLLCSQEVHNPNPLNDFLDEQQKTQLEDAFQRAFDSSSSYDWQNLLDDDDDDEQSKTSSMQKNCRDHKS